MNEEKITGTKDDLALPASGGNDMMECSIYQNFSASEVFVQGIAGIINQQDVESMIRAQKKMLQRFEKTNEMLSNCNHLSKSRLERATRDFKVHKTYLMEMRSDLENVLKRIKVIKQRVALQYPEAFAAVGGTQGPAKEEDDEYDLKIKAKKLQQLENLGAKPKR